MSGISDEQSAEYLIIYTKFVKIVYTMKNLGYSKKELKKDIDSIFARVG